MAVRLYPLTDDPIVLEKLAGVPAGTAAQVQTLEAKHAGDYDLFLDEVWASEPLKAYYQFTGSGWTKMAYPQGNVGILRSLPRCDENNGATNDPAFTRLILQWNSVTLPAGVTIAEIGGVCWG